MPGLFLMIPIKNFYLDLTLGLGSYPSTISDYTAGACPTTDGYENTPRLNVRRLKP